MIVAGVWLPWPLAILALMVWAYFKVLGYVLKYSIVIIAFIIAVLIAGCKLIWHLGRKIWDKARKTTVSWNEAT